MIISPSPTSKEMLETTARIYRLSKYRNMRLFFYNSYSQGKGFRILEKSFNNDKLAEPSLVPQEISNDFINGGITLSLRPTSDFAKSYLLVKGIEEENQNKKFDEPGRKIFINFALLADSKEYSELTHLCVSMLSNWNNFCHYLLEVFTVDFTDSFGYTINTVKWNRLIGYLSSFKIPSDSNYLLQKIEVENQSDKARLVVFSRNKRYYDDQAEMLNEMTESRPNAVPILNVVEDDDFKCLTEGCPSLQYDIFKTQIDNCSDNDSHIDCENQPETSDDSLLTESALSKSYHPLWIAIAFFIGLLIGLTIGYLL